MIFRSYHSFDIRAPRSCSGAGPSASAWSSMRRNATSRIRDSLFIGAVGRPDLPGQARKNASELYDSLHTRLLSLPGDVEIFPGTSRGRPAGRG
jgi:hypothetical protein